MTHAASPAPTRHDPPPALIFGMDDARGLYAARALAARGVPVIGVVRSRLSPGALTRVCRRIVVADVDHEHSVDRLEQIGRRLGRRAVLFSSFDSSALLIARHRDRLEQWFRIAQPAPDTVEMMVDKVSFYAHAELRGFPIPRTRFLHDAGDVERAADELSFPCVVKPSNSKHPDWLRRTHIKALRASGPHDLRRHYHDYSGSAAGPLIAQEWVEGPESNIHACHVYFDERGEPLVTFTCRKVRQWPPDVGDASLTEEVRAEPVRELTIDLFREVGYRGIGCLEIKKDARDGRFVLIEPNVRLTAHGAIAEAGGVELMYTAYCDQAGLPIPERVVQTYGSAKWIFLRKDVQAGIHRWRNGELGALAWWRSIRGRKVDAMFSWRDPGPFVADLLRGVRLLASQREKEKRDFRAPAEPTPVGAAHTAGPGGA